MTTATHPARETREPDNLRDQAIGRLRKKEEFRTHALVYVTVNVVLVVIWALTSRGFFWPMFPMLGWGIGLFFHAWDTYRRPDLSEDRIAREMERLRGRG